MTQDQEAAVVGSAAWQQKLQSAQNAAESLLNPDISGGKIAFYDEWKNTTFKFEDS